MNFHYYYQILSYPNLAVSELFLDILIKEDLVPAEKVFLTKFVNMTRELSLVMFEELYTSTFDIQGVCCLDLGFILFGEDYKRGEFLVGFSATQKKYGVDTGTELADHLPNAMKLLHVMPNGEERIELIKLALIPAVAKMIGFFTPGDTNCNPYRFILQGLLMRLNFELEKMDEVTYV